MADTFVINVPGGGGIMIETISRNRRGAIVKWLSRSMPITAEFDDETIEAMWQSMRQPTHGDREAYCIKVEISAVQGSDGNVSQRR